MHRLSGNKIPLIICAAMAVIAANGCQPIPAVAVPQARIPTIAETAPPHQLVIKFKPHTISCDPEGIARLALSTQVHLEYIRLMSGNACVIRQFAGVTNGFLREQELLMRHPDVEWVEQDGRRSAQ